MKRLPVQQTALKTTVTIMAALTAAIVFLSCGSTKYDYIGTWRERPNSRTYINSDQNISITFPVADWQVYTQPKGDIENIWDLPLWDDSAVTLLIATAPQGQMVQVIVEPNPQGELFDDYLEDVKWDIDSAFSPTRKITWHENKKVEHGGRTVGLVNYSYDPDETMMAVFDDRTQFVLISYSCPRGDFAKHEDIFWLIVDSYRSLGR